MNDRLLDDKFYKPNPRYICPLCKKRRPDVCQLGCWRCVGRLQKIRDAKRASKLKGIREYQTFAWAEKQKRLNAASEDGDNS